MGFLTKQKKVDRPLLISLVVLVVVGFIIFSSASLGLLAKGTAAYKSATFNQLAFGIGLGGLACFLCALIPYSFWKKNAFWIFLFSSFTMLLVFVPGVGISTLGARRWIHLGTYSIQPVEFYKIGFVLYLAVWLTMFKSKISTFKKGTLPFIILMIISAALILAQPDTDTFFVVFLAGLGMFIAAGGRWRDIFLLGLASVILIAALAFSRPYVMKRIETFIHPANDPLNSGYQVQQSLIAIGSGQLTGRGYGQSIQKFNFLPESNSDSIFAVAAEEFGFVGSVVVVLLYLFFAFRGLKIAIRVPDIFGRLVTVGIVILIISQSLVNMAAMLAIMPLSGTPLLFISHGGTAMLFALASVGIVLNISRYQSLKKS
ncbi:MAG: putative peptidoglycan glycosyltransferase FtsW [Candidatus Pacebacteria bacterium]|nr:putative peptidoglycan glycosyltransferase FtsW [Candidatus Paceibacterota bacterium]